MSSSQSTTLTQFTEGDLKGFKYFGELIPLLKRFHRVKSHHNRVLHYDQYLSLLLLYFFNPILTSLRALQRASQLEKVQKTLGIKQTSLGSLSEAAHVFDATLIIPIINELAHKACPVLRDPRLKAIEHTLVTQDGTLLPALPKMLWALWVDEHHRALKVHLEFDILNNIPLYATITNANVSEKKVLRQSLVRNKLYVLDAGYAQYSLLGEITKAGSSFVARLSALAHKYGDVLLHC